MRTKLRSLLAPVITMLLIMQSLMPGVWAANEQMVQNADSAATAEVSAEPPVEPAGEPEPSEPTDPVQQDEIVEETGPAEPQTIYVWLDNPVLTESTYKNATCDTPPFLNLQPLRNNPAIEKVEITDQWGNVNYNFVLEQAAGATFWVKVTFVANHVLDSTSYWEWTAGPAANEALIKIQFAPAPTDEECTTFQTLPAPTVTVENDEIEVELEAIAAVDGVKSVKVEGDVVAGDDVTVSVSFEHRFGVDTVASPGWEVQADKTATYKLAIPDADDADSDEGHEGDGKTEDGESEGEGSSEEGNLAEDLTLVTLPAPETLVMEDADSDTATENVSSQIEAIEGVEEVETIAPTADEAQIGPVSLMSTSSAPAETSTSVEVAVTFEEGYSLDEENSPQWQLQSDGMAIASFQIATPIVAPQSVDPNPSGITSFNITEAVVTDWSQEISFNFEYHIQSPDNEDLEENDGFSFFVDGFSALGLDLTGPNEIELLDNQANTVGWVSIDSAGNGNLRIVNVNPGDTSQTGTFDFRLVAEQLRDQADEEDSTELPFVVEQTNGMADITGSLTLPPDPTTPVVTPTPGSKPTKTGAFTDREHGRYDPEGAISWEVRAPSGPASKAVLTDTEEAGNWEFQTNTDGTLRYELLNVSSEDVTVAYDESTGTVTVTFDEYTQENASQTPGIRFFANITNTENSSNPSESTLTFNNTVNSEVWGWDSSEGDPLTTGDADASVTQYGTGPGEGSGVNPKKDVAWTDSADQGRTNPTGAITWTVRAPAGPANGVVLTDTVPAGENWTFVCDSVTELDSNNTNLGSASWALTSCSPTEIVVTIGAYQEWDINNTPGFQVQATITDNQWGDERDAMTFYNVVNSTLTVWGGNGIATGSDDATITQKQPPLPNTNPNKSGGFTGRDNGEFRPDGAIEWTIQMPTGPNGYLQLTDTAPADGSWVFDCDSVVVRNGDPVPNISCDPDGNLIITYADGYGAGVTPVITVKADIAREFEDGSTFTNVVTTRVGDYIQDNEFPGGNDGYIGGGDDATITQRKFQGGTGQRGQRGEFLVSIGDRVWFDANRDGQQGPTALEPGLEGVAVELFEKNPDSGEWVSFGTTTTNSDGYYWFTGLASDGEYYLQFIEPTELPDGRALGGWTTKGGGDENNIDPNTWIEGDSNVDDDGRVYFTAPTMGANEGGANVTDNMTLDAGVVLPSVSVGNYVWLDNDRLGDQSSDEPGVDGVRVILTLPNGDTRETTTSGGGYYVFTDLEPNTNYSIQFVKPVGTNWTIQGNPADMENDGDSNVDPNTGIATFRTPGSGENSDVPGEADLPTIDAGLVPVVSVGDYVWIDTNANGLQDDGETGVGNVTVTLYKGGSMVDSTSTDSSGYYAFTDLIPGENDYHVVFSNTPNGYIWTTQAAGDDQAADSNVNSSGVTPTFSAPAYEAGVTKNSAEPGQADDPTIDAGLVKVVSIGNYVWLDENRNGIQDDGEPGLDGVQVLLQSVGIESGEPGYKYLYTTTTDGGYYAYNNLLPGADYELTFFLPSTGPNDPAYTWTIQDASGNTADQDDDNDSDVDRNTGKVAFTAPLDGNNSIVPAEVDNPTLDAGIFTAVSVGDYVWIDWNRDGIQNESVEDGIPGVVVTITNTDGQDPRVLPSVTTNAEGYYWFQDLVPGAAYDIQFELPASVTVDGTAYTGWEWTTQGTGDTPAVANDSDVNADGIVSFTAPTRGNNYGMPERTDNPRLDAGIVPLVSLGDYVWVDWNRDGIQDADEPGVEGATVTLYSIDGGTVSQVGTTTTDSDGGYSFVDLDPSLSYQVHFELPETILGSEAWVFTQQVGSILDGDNSDANAALGTADYGWTSVFEMPSLGNNQPHDSEVGVDRPEIDAGVIPLVSMGDYVWIDWNRDGLQGDDEPGVEGATVTLYSIDGDAISEVGSTTTDANGGYSFVDLDPTLSYQVHFELPETILGSEAWVFTQQVGSILDGDNSDANAALGTVDYGWTSVFDLPEHGDNQTHESETGVDRPEIDAGVIPLVSMGDYVWIDWNRDGLQNDDEPGVEGATVTLYSIDGDVISTVGSTTTDANGGYSFVDLDPTLSYQVHFELPETILGSEAWVFTQQVGSILDGDNSDANAALGTVDYGWTSVFDLPEHGDNQTHESETGVDRPEIDAGVIPLVSMGDYVWIDWNRDGIQNEGAEDGVEGVIVTLHRTDGDDAGVVGTTTTDGNGGYSFVDLDPTGTYRVQFELPETILGYEGWMFTQNVGSILDGDNSDANNDRDDAEYGWTAEFTLPEHGDNQTHESEAGVDRPEVDAGVIPLVSIGDYVWDDENRDGIQDPGEPGVPGVKVTIYGPDGEKVAETTTDENGYYSFKDLIPETKYTVEFEKPDGYAGWTTPNEGDDTSVDSNVDPNGRTTVTTPELGDNKTEPNEADDPTIDAGLVRLISVGDYVWYDYDRDGIQDDDESPIAGVTVTINGPDGFTDTTTTDENGYYSFVDLLPETEYTITFEKPDGYTQWTTPNAGDDDAVDSNVDETGSYTFTTPKHGNNLPGPNEADDPTIDAGLVKLVSVGDYVWYDENGNGIQDPGEPPAAGIVVHIYQGEKIFGTTTTDPNGYYAFKDLFPNTEYTIVFEKPDGYNWTQQGAGNDPSVDSNVNPFGVITFTTPDSGNNLTDPGMADNPTLDAGLVVKPVPTDPDPEKDPEPVKELPSTGSGVESNALAFAMASMAGLMLAAIGFRLSAYQRQ